MNYNRKNYHEKTCFDFCCGIISFGACESNSEILQKPEPEPGNQGNISKEEPFLRLMSFNIRNEAPEDTGAQTWEARKGPILKMWRELNPDVIGIQESQDKLAKYLMENLREYDCIREGQMIMYRRSRFHRINSGVFGLVKLLIFQNPQDGIHANPAKQFGSVSKIKKPAESSRSTILTWTIRVWKLVLMVQKSTLHE